MAASAAHASVTRNGVGSEASRSAAVASAPTESTSRGPSRSTRPARAAAARAAASSPSWSRRSAVGAVNGWSTYHASRRSSAVRTAGGSEPSREGPRCGRPGQRVGQDRVGQAESGGNRRGGSWATERIALGVVGEQSLEVRGEPVPASVASAPPGCDLAAGFAGEAHRDQVGRTDRGSVGDLRRDVGRRPYGSKRGSAIARGPSSDQRGRPHVQDGQPDQRARTPWIADQRPLADVERKRLSKREPYVVIAEEPDATLDRCGSDVEDRRPPNRLA